MIFSINCCLQGSVCVALDFAGKSTFGDNALTSFALNLRPASGKKTWFQCGSCCGISTQGLGTPQVTTTKCTQYRWNFQVISWGFHDCMHLRGDPVFFLGSAWFGNNWKPFRTTYMTFWKYVFLIADVYFGRFWDPPFCTWTTGTLNIINSGAITACQVPRDPARPFEASVPRLEKEPWPQPTGELPTSWTGKII